MASAVILFHLASAVALPANEFHDLCTGAFGSHSLSSLSIPLEFAAAPGHCVCWSKLQYQRTLQAIGQEVPTAPGL